MAPAPKEGMRGSRRGPHKATMATAKVKPAKVETAAKKAQIRPLINARWFRERMAAVGLEQQEIARHWQVPPSSVSKTFAGKRRMQIQEATDLARLLSVSLDEVMLHAGIRPPDIRGERSVPVVGWVDGTLTVHHEPPKGAKYAPCPPGVNPDTGVVALRLQTAGTPNDFMDGWLIYYRPTEGVDPETIGHGQAVVQVPGDGRVYLRGVRRGYREGRYNLLLLSGQVAEEDVPLISASKVLWIRT